MYIFIPLIHAFPGKLQRTQGLKSLLKYTYRTIVRNNGYSMMEKLKHVMGEDLMNEYLCFFSLRNHTVLNDVPNTELIYIHAKVLIVDDTKAIIGSANINDRSLLGYRDSEVSVLLDAEDKCPGVINGREVEVSQTIRKFRMDLFKIFLDEEDDRLFLDPLSDQMHKMIIERAKNNTTLYREIFNVVPDDFCQTLEDFIEFKPGEYMAADLIMLKSRYSKYKNGIRGFIVEFPLHFLAKENLDRPIFCKEKLLDIKTML